MRLSDPTRSLATILFPLTTMLSLVPAASAELTFELVNTLGDAELVQAADVKLNSLERLYVVDNTLGKVFVFDRAGNPLFDWGGMLISASLDIDANDVVYVGEYVGISVWTSTGTPLGVIVPWGLQDGELYFTRGVALTPDGTRIYAVDRTRRVQVFDTTGRFLFRWDHPSLQSQGILLDAAGDVWVSGADPDRVYKYDGDGNFILEIDMFSSSLRKLTQDRLGRILVAEYEARTVQLFDTTGTHLGDFGTGALPYGLAVDSINDFFVATGGEIQHWRETTPISVESASWGKLKAQYSGPN